MIAQTNHGRLSDVVHVGHLLANAAQTSRTHVSCADRRLNCIAWDHGDPTVIRYLSYRQSPVIANDCSNFSNHFLVSRCWRSPERGSLSAEFLPSLNRRNQPNTCVRRIASSPYACCNNWYVSVAVFSDFKTKLDANALFGTFTHRKNRYDIKARVISATYCSQLSKRSHLQLVSWVAKTCTNISSLIANTSHPVNNHYNSNPDAIWTNLVPG